MSSSNPPEKSRGLGDTIKKVTRKMGIKQCSACKKRQERLNKMFPYISKKKRQAHAKMVEANNKAERAQQRKASKIRRELEAVIKEGKIRQSLENPPTEEETEE
jgi:hypothetical protein